MRNNSFEALEPRRLMSAGDVNLSFGMHGKVVGHVQVPADVGLSAPTATDMVLQADGKAVVVGNVSKGSQKLVLVARFNVDGSSDTAYGSGGFTTVDFGGQGAFGAAITLDASGRAVIAGSATNSDGSKTSFALARLTTAGKLDASFSSDGKLITSFAQKIAQVNDIAIGADGRIVAAGFSEDAPGTSRFAVARYKADGSLDTGFSVDGLQTVDADSGDDAANVVTVLGDGRVVMAGYLTRAGAQSNMAVVRLTSTGQLDKTFDGNGIAAVDFGGNEEVTSLLLDNGKYVLAGHSDVADAQNHPTAVVVARLTDIGAPDAAFSGDGKFALGADATEPVVVKPGPGGGYRVFYFNSDLWELRLLATGTPDPNFGFSGIDVLPHSGQLPSQFSNGQQEFVNIETKADGSAVVAYNDRSNAVNLGPPDFIQIVPTSGVSKIKLSGPILTRQITDAAVGLDGKLVLVGNSQFDYVFNRYNTNSTIDTSFGGDGRVEFPGQTSAYQHTPKLLVRSDGTYVGYGPDADLGDLDNIATILRRVSAAGVPDLNYGQNHTAWGITDDEAGGSRVDLLPRDYISITYDQFTLDERLGVLVKPDGSALDFLIPEDDDSEIEAMGTIRPIGTSDAVFITGAGRDANNQHVDLIEKIGADGKLDKTFDGDGVLFGTFDLVAAQADGKFLYRSGGGLKRRTASGAADSSFGNKGLAAAGYSNFTFDSLQRIIAWKTLSNGDIRIARFTPNGQADVYFGGGDGVIDVHPDVSGDANVVLKPNDDIVVSTVKRSGDKVDWFATDLIGGAFARVSNGKLIVEGSSRGDKITLSASKTSISVTANGMTKTFGRSQIKSIEVDGLGGSDLVTIDTSMPAVKIDGGDGNDKLTGGNGNDTILGGAGNDDIDGRGGADSLSGASGDDRFYSKDGLKDSLDGGSGFDTAKRDNGAVKDSVLSIESFI